MAYGFEKKMAKNDDVVKVYLDEEMYFEAWIMIIRHWDGKTDDEWQKLYDEFEREIYKKSTKLTDEDAISLNMEFFDCRRNVLGY